MAKNRIVYLIWLVSVGVLHVFSSEFGTRVILYASVIIPVLMVIFAWVNSRRVAFSLKLPKTCGRGEEVAVLIQPKGMLLPGHVKYRLLCENLFTGERWEATEFSVCSTYCGMLSVSLSQLSAVDVFGLFAWKINRKPHDFMLIMPERLDIPLEIGPDERMDSNSEEYSMRHPGNDPSETFAIREYIPGDLLKSIHWKLSRKTDKLLVRELGLPIAKKILILMETSVIEPEQADKAASFIYSIAHGLVLQGIAPTIGWLDTSSMTYNNHEITSLTELDAVLAELLANTVKDCGISISEAFSAVANENEYSHIIIAGQTI